jgi:anti-anti-sigma factor
MATSTAEIRNTTCFVTLAGEFDRGNVDKLRAEIEACLSETSSVLFDFGAVTFINGAVMSLLHDVYERLGDDAGWLGVARPLARIEKLFRVAGLSDLPRFRVFSTLKDALEATER